MADNDTITFSNKAEFRTRSISPERSGESRLRIAAERDAMNSFDHIGVRLAFASNKHAPSLTPTRRRTTPIAD